MQKFEVHRTCEVCGQTFTTKSLTSKYCSQRCSKLASKRRKAEEEKRQRFAAVVSQIADDRDYISISEAVAIFCIGRDTLYRLIRSGSIPAINIGKRLTRISRSKLEEMFTRRDELPEEPAPKKKQYSLEPEDCYTIGEISEKFHVGETTVYTHIRKYSIPTRQIGRFVYVPKSEIDELYR